ncbi:MAG: HAD-IB family phosphatase [Thermoplasmatales archaeon]|nr:HAD-IB family phosphatase [Thermoplasmatales archaeon]
MLIVFDMDGVFIEERSSWKVIHKKYGIKNDDIVEAYKKGEIDDEEFLNRDIERWREKGIRKENIEKIFNSIDLTSGCRECIEYLNEIGEIAIISGGIDTLAKRIANFGIKYVFANGIIYRENLPWKAILNVPLMEKGKVLEKLIEKLGVEKENVIVIGDTKYDIDMFRRAGVKIAFNPTDEIKNFANFVVEKRDLNELIKIFEKYIKI